jgi:hypothetical protein
VIVAADTHVHLYPEHDLGLALTRGIANLVRLADHVAARETRTCALFLTERHDCHAFKSLLEGASAPPGLELNRSASSAAIELRSETGRTYLFPGRQIATRERLEVLCLTVDADIADGLALDEALDRVRSAGGVPVVPFAPGKWLGKRGRLLQQVLASEGGRDVLVSDSALRPLFWPRPALMTAAGPQLLAGSDPLPLPGEERRVGSYATLWRTELDWREPTAAARTLLHTPPLAFAGNRLTPWSLATRLRRLAWSQRTATPIGTL